MNIKAASLTPEQALAELEARYEASVTALRKAIGDYIDHNTLPDTEARAEGLFVYPQLSVSWDGADHKALKTRAWGRFTHAGCYTTTITNPKLFRNYLLEQLTLLYQDYGAHISVELSQHEIPYPYVIDGSTLTLDRSMSAGLTRYFPTTELSQIGDETADGLFHPTEFYPLSHFDARRVDFSLARLRHYTGTPAEHFQPYGLQPDPRSRQPLYRSLLRRRDLDHRRDRSAGTGHFRSGVEEAPDAGLASDHPRRQRDHPD